MKFPRLRIHLLTAIILQIELGVLIWANVRQQAFHGMEQFEFGGEVVAIGFLDDGPDGLKSHYGWPMRSLVKVELMGMTREFKNFRSGEFHLIWNYRNGAVNFLFVFACNVFTYFACERLLFRAKPSTLNLQPETHSP